MRLKTTLLLLTNLLYFSYAEAQSCDSADFEERNGLAVVELDSKTTGGWDKRAESGSSGGQALYYDGSNSFSTPPGNSVITYKVKVNSPGTYRIITRNKIGIITTGPERPTSEHNDFWLKINGSEFFGQRDGTKLYPKGSGRTPNPAGSSGNGYMKVYTNTLGWNWTSLTNDGSGYPIYVTFSSAGVYDVQVGGRSNGLFVDKLALYKEGSVSASAAQSASATTCDGSSPTPAPAPVENSSPSVRFSTISNGQSFTNGSDISIGLSSNDSDGSVVGHKVFVNDVLVDTDGASYTPYQITGAAAGTYVIKATVTDNDGASSTASATITVNAVPTPTPPAPTPTPPAPTPTPPTADNSAPSVSFSNLSSGEQVASGSTVSVGLSANDSDGSVVKYQIFVNGTLVDTDGTAYTPHPITAIGAGSYAIKAVVTDNDGATAETTVNITAVDATPPTTVNAAPSVNFTNLSNGQQVAVGSTVSVRLSANDSDGSVVKYQIFVNGTLVDTDGASYTAHPIPAISAGNYVIKATVTDNDGATSSASVNITTGSSTVNTAPTVRFTNLRNGQRIFTGSTAYVNLSANDSDGNVIAHKIFVNGTLVDTDGARYSSHPIVNISTGNYAVTATVTDNDGATSSATVNITVIPSGSSTSAKTAFVYPNPVKADGRVSLKLANGGSGDYQYSISNATGVTLESGKFSADQSQTNVDLKLSNVGNQGEGVYYMTLISKESKQVIPIIRE